MERHRANVRSFPVSSSVDEKMITVFFFFFSIFLLSINLSSLSSPSHLLSQLTHIPVILFTLFFLTPYFPSFPFLSFFFTLSFSSTSRSIPLFLQPTHPLFSRSTLRPTRLPSTASRCSVRVRYCLAGTGTVRSLPGTATRTLRRSRRPG